MGDCHITFVGWQAFLQAISEQHEHAQACCRHERWECLLQNPGIIPWIVCWPQIREAVQESSEELHCRITLSAPGKKVNQCADFVSEEPLIREVQPVDHPGDEWLRDGQR